MSDVPTLLATAIGGGVVVKLAEWLVAWFRKPNIEITYGDAEGFAVKTPIDWKENGQDVKYEAKYLIPTPIDQNACAHWRNPMDMMRQG